MLKKNPKIHNKVNFAYKEVLSQEQAKSFIFIDFVKL